MRATSRSTRLSRLISGSTNRLCWRSRENDPFFLPSGVKVYRHDVPKADIRFLDTCLFALETHARVIAGTIAELLGPQTVGQLR
jgi:hypothetical protein